MALGAVFDTDDRGVWQLAREGGHSTARVVHAGGAATGLEMEPTLVDGGPRSAAALVEGWFALDLLVEGGRCRGVTALDPAGGRRAAGHHTLLASGGAGQLFSVTTNPAQSTGDGLAMALRAGVAVADVEFMQFHPTGLHARRAPARCSPRRCGGDGALLRDAAAALRRRAAPRDVVSGP